MQNLNDQFPYCWQTFTHSFEPYPDSRADSCGGLYRTRDSGISLVSASSFADRRRKTRAHGNTSESQLCTQMNRQGTEWITNWLVKSSSAMCNLSGLRHSRPDQTAFDCWAQRQFGPGSSASSLEPLIMDLVAASPISHTLLPQEHLRLLGRSFPLLESWIFRSDIFSALSLWSARFCGDPLLLSFPCGLTKPPGKPR